MKFGSMFYYFYPCKRNFLFIFKTQKCKYFYNTIFMFGRLTFENHLRGKKVDRTRKKD